MSATLTDPQLLRARSDPRRSSDSAYWPHLLLTGGLGLGERPLGPMLEEDLDPGLPVPVQPQVPGGVTAPRPSAFALPARHPP